MTTLTPERRAELKRLRAQKPTPEGWQKMYDAIPSLLLEVERLERERDDYKSAACRIEDLRRRETADHEAELLLIWRAAMPIKVLAGGKKPCPTVLIDRIVELLRYEERCGADKGGNRP